MAMKKLRLGRKQAETLMRFYDEKETWSGESYWCGISFHRLQRSPNGEKPWWPQMDSLVVAGYLIVRVCREFDCNGERFPYAQVMLTGLGVSALLENGYITDPRVIIKKETP